MVASCTPIQKFELWPSADQVLNGLAWNGNDSEILVTPPPSPPKLSKPRHSPSHPPPNPQILARPPSASPGPDRPPTRTQPGSGLSPHRTL